MEAAIRTTAIRRTATRSLRQLADLLREQHARLQRADSVAARQAILRDCSGALAYVQCLLSEAR